MLRKLSKQPVDDLSSDDESQSLVQNNQDDESITFYQNQSRDDISTVNVADLHDWRKDVSLEENSEKISKPTSSKTSVGNNRKNKPNTQKRWTWTDDMIENLIYNIQEFKNTKTFEGIDFEADLIEMYEGVRRMVAAMYPPTDFGPVSIPLQETDEMTREELMEYKQIVDRLEKQRKEGYNRVKAKVKELRRGYKTAVDQGTRSGSGRLVKENFELLKDIWSGCPSVSSLGGAITSLETAIGSDFVEQEVAEEDGFESVVDRPVVDNKRAKLQKKISAHQRDMLMIDISREELSLKKENIALLRESIEQTNSVMKAMTDSLNAVGNSVKEGLALIAQSFLQSSQMQQPPMPQQYQYQMYGGMMSPPTAKFQTQPHRNGESSEN